MFRTSLASTVRSSLTVLILVLALAVSSQAKTVGLWKDGRSYIGDGMVKTLQEAGWQTVILQGGDLSNEAKLATLDVIFLPAGWNAYYFADFHARRCLVKFVAGGKGILAGAFRSGYVRTANRPFFPEVGAAHNRVNGPYVFPSGDSELAKAIDQPFCPNGWDHIVIKVGPKGKVFAVSGDDPVGVYGEVYGGRYVAFGAFIGIDAKTEPMQGTDRNLLLAMLDWCNAAPKLDDAQKAAQVAQADLDYLRREKYWDWTADERGPDRGCGVIPQQYNFLAAALESRLFTLQYMRQYLPADQEARHRAASQALEKAVAELKANYTRQLAATRADLEKMTLAELLAEAPEVENPGLVAKVEAVPGKSDEERKAMVALVKRSPKAPTTYAGKEVAAFLHGAEVSEKLFPQAALKKLVADADVVLAAFRPLVAAAKAKALAAEHAADLAALPDLVKAAASPDVAVRRHAADELGRIGAPECAAPLLRMLEDADERVRATAIIGLGWMQAKDAVPALLKLAEGKDLSASRRAVQALGQIGDERAVPVLVTAIGSPDFFTAENAIMALGWLKAKAAVAPLLKLVTDSDRKDTRQRSLMLAAVRALGHLGDAAALPALQKLATEADDYPMDRRGRKKITNPYSTAQSLGLKGHAELAIAEIQAGGRQEVGLRQGEFLARKDKFYGLTGRFNAFAGRSSPVRDSIFGADPNGLWPYLWEGGFTGVHQAWGEQEAEPRQYCAQVKAASDFDLLWIDVMPTGGNMFGAKDCSRKYGPHGVEKPGAELVLLQYQDVPAFHGFWSEETYPDCGVPGPEFEAWLKQQHGADFRQQLGVPADFDIAKAEWATWAKGPHPQALKVEFLRWGAAWLLDGWRESQDWLHGVRKGCAFTYSVSEAQPFKYPGVTARAGGLIDANGPETYQCFGLFNAFFMEMQKDGEARPVMSEFYNWYTPTPAHGIRGFAQHLMHGECFYNFALNHIFALPATYDMWSWDTARWPDARRIFLKARQVREYLEVPASAANVALVCSDLTTLAFSPLNDYGASLIPRWMQQQVALWTALNQSQIPTDVIMTDTLTPQKLKRYRVLVLSDAKTISPEQAALLADWVNAGGTLIASGTTSLFDSWGRPQGDYAMAKLFGVSYAGYGGMLPPDQHDTYCWGRGTAPTAVKVIPGLEPANWQNHVHRAIKPVKSLRTYAVAAGKEALLPGLAPQAKCEYDLPLGYDRVKPGAAEVLAAFAEGDPALTVNRVGQGLCYFWAPIYPGLCHVASDWEMQANRLDFWPNVRELLAAMVKGGLAQQHAALPVEVLGVPTAVEVTLRQQPDRRRTMVHLLNYDPRLALVAKARLLVHPPAGAKVKRLFYPDTNTEVPGEVTPQGVGAPLRDFDVYDLLVIEWE